MGTNRVFEATVDIPEPFQLKKVKDYFKFLIGPGIIALGLGLGTGEVVCTPYLVVESGPRMLWVAFLSIIIQTYTSIIGSKYTIITGEPLQIGMNRLFMSKKIWTPIWVLMGIFQIIIPYYPALLGMTFVAMIINDIPSIPENQTLWIIFGLLALIICLIPLFVGKKIMKTLGTLFFLIHFLIIIPLLIIITLVTVPGNVIWEVVQGFFSVGYIPENPNWLAMGAVAGFAGLAASAGLSISTYYRDSGWGMSQLMGAIPGAVGGGKKVEFKTIGYLPKTDKMNQKRAKKWISYIIAELLPIFFVGSIITMIFPVALFYYFVPTEAATQEIFGFTAVLAQNLQFISPVVDWWLILVMLSAIFFVDGSAVIDGMVRNYTNMIWNSYSGLQKKMKGDVRYLYYGILGIFVIVWIVMIMTGTPPITMTLYAGAFANIGGIIFCLGTIGVNYLVTPKEYRLSVLEVILMVIAIIFFTFFLSTAFL